VVDRVNLRHDASPSRKAALAVLAWSCAWSALAATQTSFAQDTYPTKPLRIIVAFTPASTADILARALGNKLTEAWAQPVTVDNRPGARGNIGTAAAAKAPADGHTLLMGTVVTHGINPALYPTLPYDAIADFTPISLTAIMPQIVVVAGSLPVRNLRDLIVHAKARPGALAYGAPGNASVGHLSAELLQSMAGIRLGRVSYKQGADAVKGLMTGEIQVVIDDIPSYLPHVKAGRIRALAVTPSERSPVAPGLPTVEEAGVKGYRASSWFGLFAPAGTPTEVVARLAAQVQRILSQSEVRDRVQALGAQPAGSSPEAFASFVQAEIAKWGEVIRGANVAPE
jgi:tripartite-type tricarboxylate transporter receptor subunit TctC